MPVLFKKACAGQGRPLNNISTGPTPENNTSATELFILSDVMEEIFLLVLRPIAVILLIIFSLVQVAPAIQSFMPDTKVSLFSPDEEKSEKGTPEKQEKKESKDFTFNDALTCGISIRQMLHGAAGVTLHPSPYVEHHTPPPNFA